MDHVTQPDDDITVEIAIEADDVAVITVAGEIDITTVAQIDAAVDRATDAHARRIVFDLSAVEFMDSSGIATLIRSRAVAATIVLRKPSAAVQRVLVATGLGDTLPVEP